MQMEHHHTSGGGAVCVKTIEPLAGQSMIRGCEGSPKMFIG
jgi:hypothetical protein